MQQSPCLLWFTGLSGSGKSTIAGMVEQQLSKSGFHTYLLDGDNLRHGLCRNLGFGLEDRTENIRRAGEVSKLMIDAGLLVLTALISPLRADRESVRALFSASEFIEIFVDTPLEECERRDPKGLYKRARAGQIPDFTGIASPYESPMHPTIRLETMQQSAQECADQVIKHLTTSEFLNSKLRSKRVDQVLSRP
jgi:adenylyl-sulfate kinase